MIITELSITILFVNEDRSHEIGHLWREYLQCWWMSWIIVIKIISIVIPDIQNALRWYACSTIGEGLVGICHLQHASIFCTQGPGHTEILHLAHSQAVHRREHILWPGIFHRSHCTDVL